MKPKNPSNPDISRVLRSREEARASYDGLSRWYDALAGSERRFTDGGVDALAPVPGERILEIGFGTGRALVRLARAVGMTGRVYGIDISRGMRAVAENRVRRAGLSSCIQLTTGDASMLPFRSASLDAIFMSFTLELFDTPEIPVVLKECGRVMVPEGRICVISIAAGEHPGLALRLYERMHEHFPKAIDCRPIMVSQSLEAAGFRILLADRRQIWGLPIEICVAGKKWADSSPALAARRLRKP